MINIAVASDDFNETTDSTNSNFTSTQTLSNFTSIQTLIDEADDGDTIYLNNNTYTNEGESIKINKSITIEGSDNTVLDACEKSNIFVIDENVTVNLNRFTLTNSLNKDKESTMLNKGNLTMNNLKITNSKGSVIYTTNTSKLTIIDSEFNSNSQGSVLTIDKGTVLIKGSIFKNSSSSNGGAIYLKKGILDIYDTLFIENTAQIGGVIYNREGTLNVYSSRFRQNKATNGGAIHNIGNLTIANCEFTQQITSNMGGALNIIKGTAVISDSKFIKNSKADQGGCISNIDGTIYITNCEFSSNVVKNYGAAIDNGGFIDIKDSIFRDNTGYGAGAIDNGGTLIINNSQFIDNFVTKNGGTIDSKGMLTITYCTFKNNEALGQGGAIIIRGNTTVTNSKFIDNKGGVGDAIYLNNISYSINGNWWGSNNPDFSKLLNCIPDDLTWINITSDITDNNTNDSPNIGSIITSKIICNNINTVFNINKNLIITLKDIKGNPIKNAKINVKVNNKNYAKVTNNNGQIQIALSLAPKTYTATITYAGNDQYTGSYCKSKIVITKALPKITANKKTFKIKTKIKKYAITLKDNKGKAIKKVKVTLKVKGKKYTAKTNAKGKATFNMKKLTKKGKYKAYITYAGNAYYKKVTKSVTITIKK
jgi:hypothetical protein